MTVCGDYCDMVLESLNPLKSEMNIVLAHESSVKNVPISKTIAAIGIKKCVVTDMPEGKMDGAVSVYDESRAVYVTVGINLYVPYFKGTRGCVEAFDKVFDLLSDDNYYTMNEARMLGTKYSRETQSLVTETEFVFESFMSGVTIIEPITPAT